MITIMMLICKIYILHIGHYDVNDDDDDLKVSVHAEVLRNETVMDPVTQETGGEGYSVLVEVVVVVVVVRVAMHIFWWC